MANIRDFARMCNSYTNCQDCSKGKIPNMIECNQYMCKHPREADEALDNWCKEHPEVKVKTYADDFFERFPKARFSAL